MESPLQRMITGILAAILIFGSWLWMTAEDYEEQTAEYQIPERFRAEPKISEPDPDDIDTTRIQEPEPQMGWIVPPEPVRRGVGKIKKRVKNAVKKQ